MKTREALKFVMQSISGAANAAAMKSAAVAGIMAVLLMACSGEEPGQGHQVASNTEIRLGSIGLDHPIGTRSYYADTYNTALPAGKEIDVFIYDNEGNFVVNSDQPQTGVWIYQTVGEADGNGNSTLGLYSPTKAPKYPAENNVNKDYVTVFGVFPSDNTITKTTTSYTFSVADDQTTEANILASDLMANTSSTSTHYTYDWCNENSITLAMTHQMAKVHVTLVASGDITADNIPTALTVKNVYRTVTITPTSGTVSTSTTAPSDIAITTEQAFFLPPQTITEGTTLLQFDITATGVFHGITGATFAPSADVTFEPNKVYEVTVTVNVDFATAKASISGWVNESLSFNDYIL